MLIQYSITYEYMQSLGSPTLCVTVQCCQVAVITLTHSATGCTILVCSTYMIYTKTGLARPGNTAFVLSISVHSVLFKNVGRSLRFFIFLVVWGT
jgi:hypothetical protein